MNRGDKPLPSSSLEWVGLVSAVVFVVTTAAHWQPVLAKRVCFEIDAWFVLLQATLVSFGACAAVRWASRPTILIVTAWLWSTWLLFLDAVPVATRRRLALSRGLVGLAIVALAFEPVLLAYWFFFSPQRATIAHDRVLVRLDVGNVRFDAKLLGFVPSKLGTLWVWMGRFLWRELFRPSDAFRLIKRRVFYRVAVPRPLSP